MYLCLNVCGICLPKSFFLVLNDGCYSWPRCCFRSVRMPSRIWKTASLCTTQKTMLVWRTPGISSKLRYTYTLNFWYVASAYYVTKQKFVTLWGFFSFLIFLTTELGLDISVKAPKSKKWFCVFEFQKTNHKPLAASDNCWFMIFFFCRKWLIETSWSEKLLRKTKNSGELQAGFLPFFFSLASA